VATTLMTLSNSAAVPGGAVPGGAVPGGAVPGGAAAPVEPDATTPDAGPATTAQGLTLVQLSAQRKRYLWDKGSL